MKRLASRVITWYFRQTHLQRGKHTVAHKVVRRWFRDVRCRSRDGLWFAVDPRDLIQLNILTTGEWEPSESEVLRSELRAGDVFYDIGANCGYFTLLASQLVGDAGHVYAFEPNPEVVRKLRQNLELNGVSNVTVFPLALSDSEGTQQLSLTAGKNSGMSSFRTLDGESTSREVDVVRLDDLIEHEALRLPDFVKMDIEGAEYLAVRGMPRALGPDGASKVLIEISDQFLRELSGDEASLLDALAGHGFDVRRETSRHKRSNEDGTPFQYTALLTRSSPPSPRVGVTG